MPLQFHIPSDIKDLLSLFQGVEFAFSLTEPSLGVVGDERE